jgi:hypothetical protein
MHFLCRIFLVNTIIFFYPTKILLSVSIVSKRFVFAISERKTSLQKMPLETSCTADFPLVFMRGFISLQKDLAFVLVNHVDGVLQAAFTGGFPTITSSQDIGPVVSKL